MRSKTRGEINHTQNSIWVKVHPKRFLRRQKAGMLFAVGLIISLLTALPASAQELVWEQTNGPYGGNIGSLLATPDGTLYAAGSVSIFRSEDKGNSWTQVLTGVHYFSVLGVSGTTIYAGTINGNGIFRSDDRGKTWTQTKAGLEDVYAVTSFAVLGRTLYVGTRAYADKGHGWVFRSEDRGNTWVKTGLGGYKVEALAVIGTMLYAGTWNGVFRSEDGGDSWVSINNGLTERAKGILGISSFAMFGTTLYAATIDGAFRFDDKGETWVRMELKRERRYININSLVIVGTTLYASNGLDGVFRSEDAGHSWTTVNAGLPYPRRGGSSTLVALGPTLFLGTEGSGIFRSENGGNTWTEVNTGLTGSWVSAFAVLGPTLYVGTGDGVFRSEDGGDSWIQAGLRGLGVSSFAVLGPTLYATTNDGVFRSDGAGAHWINTGLDGVGWLVVLGTTLYSGTWGGTILRSDNGGNTWIEVHKFEGQFLRSLGGLDTTLYAATNDGVFRSRDGGNSWTAANTGLGNNQVGLFVASGPMLYATTSRGGFRSKDGGNSWVQMGMAPRSLITVSGSILYAGTWRRGVFRSEDDGHSWTQVGLMNRTVDVFAVSGATLYAGVRGGGVFRTTLPNEPPTGVSIDPEEMISPAVGEQFTVSVNITEGKNVGGYQITVTFDPTALSIVSIENADYLPAGAFATPPIVGDGSVTIAATVLTGASNGDGTLARVTFQVSEVKESTIGLVDVSISDSAANPLEVTTQHGAILTGPRQPSAVTQLIGPEGWTSDNTPNIHWNASMDEESGVVDYEYAVDDKLNSQVDNSWKSTGTTQTRLTVTPALNDGKHEVWVRAKNGAGLYSHPVRALVQVDTTPPPVVTNVRDTGDYTMGELTINWDDATDSQSGVVDYQLQVNDKRDFSGKMLFDGLIGSTISNHVFTKNRLTNGTTYYARVKAKNVAGLLSKDWSNITDGILVDFQSPSSVRNLRSGSHQVKVWSDDDAVDVVWEAATGNESGLAGYSIVWDTRFNTSPDTKVDLVASTTKATSPTLDVGSNHYVHIRAIDKAGNASDTEHLGPFYISVAPDNVASISDNGTFANQLLFDWDDVRDADDYHLQLDVDSQDFTAGMLFDGLVGNQTSQKGFTKADGIQHGKTYYARVKAINSIGLESKEWSDLTDSITVDLNPPGNVEKLTSSSHKIEVWSADSVVRNSWTLAKDDLSGLAGYSIAWDDSNSTIPDSTVEISGDVKEKFVTFSDGDNHYFHIRAIDKAGNASEAAHLGPFYIDTTPSLPVNNFQAQAIAGGKIHLIWHASESDDVSRYNIYSDDGSGTIDYSKAVGSVSHPATTWTSNTLAHNVTYRFGIRAENQAGIEEGNLSVVAIEEADRELPNPPSNLTAESLTGAKVRLTWRPSVSSDVAQYNIYWDNATGKVDYTQPTATVLHPTTTWESSTLSDGKTYTFALRAVDGVGNEEQNTTVQASGFVEINEAPKVVSLSAVSGVQAADVSVTYTLSDREKDTLDLLCEYSRDSGSSWDSATVEGATGITSENYTGVVTWHSRKDIPSTGGLEVQFRLTPKDTQGAGTPADTNAFSLVNLLGDYDDDRHVDFDDLALFSKAWNDNDAQRELGPVTGKVPDFVPAFDGVLDFEDLAVFILMWNWSHTQNPPAAPTIASHENVPSPFTFTVIPASKEAPKPHIAIELAHPLDLLAARIHLSFDPKEIQILQATKGNLWGYTGMTPVFLHRINNEGGVVEIQTVRLRNPNLTRMNDPNLPHVEGADTSADALVFLQVESSAKGDVTIHLEFDLRDGFNRVITKGQSLIRLNFEPPPKVTRLLQNYPNPFNPETWIPYQLAQDARVSIQIYSQNGELARTLELGEKPAGWYLDKSRAAYWNGTNDRGESVASGVYFYRLQTGSFTAMRKFVIVR